MRKIVIMLTIGFAITTAIFITRYSVAAEPQQQNDLSVSQVLITEIRELRRTLQEYTVINTKTQLLLERLKFQQARVNRLSDEKEAIQKEIEQAVSSYQQMEDILKSFGDQIATESDAISRINIEREQKALSMTLEQQKNLWQRLRERDLQITDQLQVEKTALSELQHSLIELGNTIDGKPSQRK